MTMVALCLAGLGTLAVLSYFKRSMARLQTQRAERKQPQARRRR